MKHFINRGSHDKEVIFREADIAIRLGIKLLLGDMGLAHVTLFWVCCLCFNRMNMKYESIIIVSYKSIFLALKILCSLPIHPFPDPRPWQPLTFLRSP